MANLYLVQALYGTKASAPDVPKVHPVDNNRNVNTPVKAEPTDKFISDVCEVSTETKCVQMSKAVPRSDSTSSVLAKPGNHCNINMPIKEEPSYEALDVALAPLKAVYQVRPHVDAHPHVDTTAEPIYYGHFHSARQQQLFEPGCKPRESIE
jgi:hypothetical protein